MNRVTIYTDAAEKASLIADYSFSFGMPGQMEKSKWITQYSPYYHSAYSVDCKEWYELQIAFEMSLTHNQFLQFDWDDILHDKKEVQSCEFCFCDDEVRWLDNKLGQEGGDLSGIHCGIKMFGSYLDRDQIGAYIDELVEKFIPIFLSVSVVNDNTCKMLDVRIEFRDDFDLLPIIKEIKKNLPDLRILAVQKEQKWEGQRIHISGNSSKKVVTRNISYQDCWDSAYNHLCAKSDYFGNHEFYEPDLMVKDDSVLKKCNSFFWADRITLADGITEIDRAAFSKNKYIKSIEIPDSVNKVRKHAFANCTSLSEVKYNQGTVFEEPVFENCKKLNRIDAEVKECETMPKGSIFTFDQIDTMNLDGSIFVLTGFDAPEEEKIQHLILQGGGEVKSSTVVKTNYLVVQENYNHQTTKYTRALELKERGKPIVIISSKQFYKLLNEPRAKMN